MTSFGGRLRQARRERGLSQSELGAERYSGSYISHLETGRRTPTAEVVDYLASRLGVAPTALVGGNGTVVTGHGELTVTIAELNARSAWEAGDFTAAIRFADLARAAAVKEGRADVWWGCTHLKAQALLALEAYDECLSVADELSQHHFAAGVPELEAEALALASRAARASGRLEDALARARRATDAVGSVGRLRASPQHIQALLALVSALGELGLLERAQEPVRRLGDLRDQVEGDHLRGLVAWSLGNIALMSGRVAEGIAEHDLAARLLNPGSDLRAWGRFCKASAAQRLAAGTIAGAGELLEKATHALLLVGNSSDRLELALTVARLSLAEGRPGAALEDASVVDAVAGELPPQTLADLAWLRHQCHLELGDRTQAAYQAAVAAERFEEAGAVSRALEAWRTHARLVSPDTPG